MNLLDFLEKIAELLTNSEFLINLVLLTFSALYSVFALVLVLQIRRLNQTINQKTFSPIFLFLTFIHALAAILITILIAATI